MREEVPAVVWTILAVLGLVCLVAGLALAFGTPAGLIAAGVGFIAVAIDGRS